MKAFLRWIVENKGLFTGICIGLAVAILFLTIGFWATLLILVCVGIGAFLGVRVDVRDNIGEKLASLFKKKDE